MAAPFAPVSRKSYSKSPCLCRNLSIEQIVPWICDTLNHAALAIAFAPRDLSVMRETSLKLTIAALILSIRILCVEHVGRREDMDSMAKEVRCLALRYRGDSVFC